MDDVEQQIRAWADATIAVAEAEANQEAAPEPAPAALGGRRWARSVLVAAAVLAIVGVVAVVARDGSDRVRTGPAAPVTTITTSRDHVVGFDVLDIGPDGGEPAGTIRAAYDAEQLADLWAELGVGKDGVRRSIGPVPDVDFDRQVVVALTLDRPACSSELIGFEHVSGRAFITPVFDEAEPECRGAPLRPRYVVAVDWDGERPSMIVELSPTEDDDGREIPGPRLQLNRLRPDLVTVDVETDIGEIHAGDQLGLKAVVQNATGEPLETTGCGAPFSIGLRRDGQLFAPARPQCLEQFVIPTGSSAYDVTLMASRSGCTTNPTAPVPERCQDDGTMPDLEPGTYEVVLLPPDGFDAVPPERTIDVVPRGS